MSVNQHAPKFENATYDFVLATDEFKQAHNEQTWKVVISDEDGVKNGAPFHCSLNGKDANLFIVSPQSQPLLSSVNPERRYQSSVWPHFCTIQPSHVNLPLGVYNFYLQALDNGDNAKWAHVPITLRVQSHTQPGTGNSKVNEPFSEKTKPSVSFKGVIWLVDVPETQANLKRRIVELSSILTSPTSSLRLDHGSGHTFTLNAQSQTLQRYFLVDSQAGIVSLRGNPTSDTFNVGVDIEEVPVSALESGEPPPEGTNKYEVLLQLEVLSVFDEMGTIKAPWKIAGLRVQGNIPRPLFYVPEQYRDRLWTLLSEKMEGPGMKLKDITVRSATWTEMDTAGQMERGGGRDFSDIFVLFHTGRPLTKEDMKQWNVDLDHMKRDLETILGRNVTYLHQNCQTRCQPSTIPCETTFRAKTALDGKDYENFVLGHTAYVVPRLQLTNDCKTSKNRQDNPYPHPSSEKEIPSKESNMRQENVFLISSQRESIWQMEPNLLPLRSLHYFMRWTRKSSGKFLQIESNMERFNFFLEKGELTYELVNLAPGNAMESITRRQGVLTSLIPRGALDATTSSSSSTWTIMRISHRDSVACSSEYSSSHSQLCSEWRILVGSLERSFQSRHPQNLFEAGNVAASWKIHWGNGLNNNEGAILDVEEESLACVKEIHVNDREWNYWRGRGLSSTHNGGLIEREECSIQGCQIDASEFVTLPCHLSSSAAGTGVCPTVAVQCNVGVSPNCLSQSESLSCTATSNSSSNTVQCHCESESSSPQSLSCQSTPVSSVTKSVFIHKNCPPNVHEPQTSTSMSPLKCYVAKDLRRQQLRCLSHNSHSVGTNILTPNHDSAALTPSHTFAGLHQHPLFPVPVAILVFLAILVVILLFLKIRQRKVILRRKRSQRVRSSTLHSPASQEDSPTHLPSPHKLLLTMPAGYSPQPPALISPANIMSSNGGCHYCDSCSYCPPYQATLPNHMQSSTLSHSSRSYWDYVTMLEQQSAPFNCIDGSLSPLCHTQAHTPNGNRPSSNYLQHLQNTTMSSNASGNTAEVASILFNPNSSTPTPILPASAPLAVVGPTAVPFHGHMRPMEYGVSTTPTESELMTISRQSSKIAQYWPQCPMESLPVGVNSQSDFSSTCDSHFDHVSLLPNSIVTPCFPRHLKDGNAILNECRPPYQIPKDSEQWSHNNNTMLY